MSGSERQKRILAFMCTSDAPFLALALRGSVVHSLHIVGNVTADQWPRCTSRASCSQAATIRAQLHLLLHGFIMLAPTSPY